MKIAVEARAPQPAGDWTLVRLVTREERRKLLRTIPEQEFSARLNSTLHLISERVFYIGLGDRAKVTAPAVRTAIGTATLALKKFARLQIAIDLTNWPQFAGAAIEGALLADYRFDRFSTKKNSALRALHLQVGKTDLPAAKSAARHARILSEATNAARAIGNLPGNILYPATLAEHAAELARDAELKITIFDERKLRARGFGGILAVGQGSEREPRLIVLEHRGGPKKQAPIALVGKAITFDTGGISIKPAAKMEDMIFDKCGGIAVLGAMTALARLGVKRNVVGVIASAENMPGAAAYRPGDIVTTYDGKHIEIVNTDAEGRVVLADAIAYARRDCGAAAIVDLATLTGACVVALGVHAAGLFDNDEPLRRALLAAAEATGERLWPLPIFPEHEDDISSDVALIKNSAGRWGGACTAAAFLKTFAEETPWAHLDIAPVGFQNKDGDGLARGASGFGIRTLVELVERWG